MRTVKYVSSLSGWESDTMDPTSIKEALMIDERKLQELSPMPQGLVKAPDELLDLLAYLLSDNPPAP